jgi:hypothetical protein
LMARLNDMLDRRWLTNAGPMSPSLSKLADRRGAACCGNDECHSGPKLVDAMGWQGSHPSVFHVHCHSHAAPAACSRFVTSMRCTTSTAQVEAAITPYGCHRRVHVWGRPCAVAEPKRSPAHRLGLASMCPRVGMYLRRKPIGGLGRRGAEFPCDEIREYIRGGRRDELGGARRAPDPSAQLRLDGEIMSPVWTNAKMPESSAAMGLGGLENLSSWVEVNRRNYRLPETLDGVAGIEILPSTGRTKQLSVSSFARRRGGLTRDELRAVLWAENALAAAFLPRLSSVGAVPQRNAGPSTGPPVTEHRPRRTDAAHGNRRRPAGDEQMGRITRLGMEHAIEVRRRLARTTPLLAAPSVVRPPARLA